MTKVLPACPAPTMMVMNGCEKMIRDYVVDDALLTILAELAQLAAEIQQGMAELKEMLS